MTVFIANPNNSLQKESFEFFNCHLFYSFSNILYIYIYIYIYKYGYTGKKPQINRPYMNE